MPPGQIVILNGSPRAGKSSIATAIQQTFPGIWMNLGVDTWAAATPLRPGIGLRPGGERSDLEPAVVLLYAALYDSIAATSRSGLNVVTDVGHHDSYSREFGILAESARRLVGLPVLFVGVSAPIDTIIARRAVNEPGREYVAATASDPIPHPVALWQSAVHAHGFYDLEIDTSQMTPAEAAARIRCMLDEDMRHPTAFERLAGA